MLNLDPRSTALVIIDLQYGILGLPWAPIPAETVLSRARNLADTFRGAGATVVLVRVGWAKGFADKLGQVVDEVVPLPSEGLPDDWSEIARDLVHQTDIVVTKRQWGAFYGTDLELQLRRRGIRTVVLSGIATNFGVESTARQAFEHGFSIVLARDVCASSTAEAHDFSVKHIFPRIARVVQASDIAFETD